MLLILIQGLLEQDSEFVGVKIKELLLKFYNLLLHEVSYKKEISFVFVGLLKIGYFLQLKLWFRLQN